MISVKARLVSFDRLRGREVDFIEIENAAVQLRKIVEEVAYASAIVAQITGRPIKLRERDNWRAALILESKELAQCLAFPIASDTTISREGHCSLDFRLGSQPKPILGPLAYVDIFKEMHAYAHGFHPLRDHPFRSDPALASAVEQIERRRGQLNAALWRHHQFIGRRVLLIDFGDRDKDHPRFHIWTRPLE